MAEVILVKLKYAKKASNKRAADKKVQCTHKLSRNSTNNEKKGSPRAKSTIPPATATADPLEHPPGTRSRAAGFVGVSKCLFSPWILKKSCALSQTHNRQIKTKKK